MFQPVEIASSPNPVGSGARALGMGGAFIAVADDATAASWNPAGLIQLETPEISIVGACSHRIASTTCHGGACKEFPQHDTRFDLNYLSAAYPFAAFRRNWIVSLNFQHLYDFNQTDAFERRLLDDSGGAVLDLMERGDFRQKGGFQCISPALAVQITPSLSVGLTLNFWSIGLSDNGYTSQYDIEAHGSLQIGGISTPVAVSYRESNRYRLQGARFSLRNPFHCRNINYHVGVLWHLSRAFTLGAVLKAPFDARMAHDVHLKTQTFISGVETPLQTRQSEIVALRMPMAYGAGLAWRIHDSVTLDLDAYRTHWDDFILTDGAGHSMSPISRQDPAVSTIAPTTQVRLGAEYLWIRNRTVIPFRAGTFYDPEPARNGPDDFFGFSLGTGLAWGPVVYDIAYQYRFGRGVRSGRNVDQHAVHLSLIYHF